MAKTKYKCQKQISFHRNIKMYIGYGPGNLQKNVAGYLPTPGLLYIASTPESVDLGSIPSWIK